MRPACAHSLRLAVALALLVALAPPAAAWDAKAHERIVTYAVRLMPAALQQQLILHKDALYEGARKPDELSSPRSHALHLDGSGGTLDRDAAADVDNVVDLVRNQGSFDELAFEFGRLSHVAADAAFPLNTSDSDPREAQYYADYTTYATSKLNRFPGIFDGFVALDGAFDVSRYVRGIAERANRSYPFVGQAYFPQAGGPMARSSGFDDRGPVFGVTQLAFVHAVSATANLWLYSWRHAHGDVTGTPHYAAAGGTSGAKDRTGTPQRP